MLQPAAAADAAAATRKDDKRHQGQSRDIDGGHSWTRPAPAQAEAEAEADTKAANASGIQPKTLSSLGDDEESKSA